MTSALNTLLSGKRKRTHNKTTDDDLYQRIGVDIIQQLLDKNTKTSWKKLRRLGVLKAGQTVEELKESFASYVKEENWIQLQGEDGGEDEDIVVEDGGSRAKAYESLLVSLASEHKDLAVAVAEEHKDLLKETDLEIDDDDHGHVTQRDGDESAHDTDDDDVVVLNDDGELDDHSSLRDEDFFGNHLDMSVESLELESVQQNRKEFSVAPKSSQCWSKVGASLEVSKDGACPNTVSQSLEDYRIRSRVASRWKQVHKVEESHRKKRFGDFESRKQAVLFGIMNSYMDVWYPLYKYPLKKEQDEKDIVTDAALLHILNHIVNSSERIKKNNEKVKNAEEPQAAFQDQGFVRPKVLILAPFRHHAKKIVDRLISLGIQETRTDTVKNRSRFDEEFGVPEEEQIMTEREKIALSLKPKQHQVLFDGNCDDHFRLGIKMTRGSIRLFTDFYDSDILVASPLALATKLEEGSKSKDEPDPSDLLSSIEIVLTVRVDVLLMQNWQHVIRIFDTLNSIPKQQHDTDIMRIRDWYIDGKAKYYRQNIILGSFQSPEIKSLMSNYCMNHSGMARWKHVQKGIFQSIIPQLRHVFHRIQKPIATPADEVDARFEYFKSEMWPLIREASHLGGQLLYVPSYFDFVKVRNYLRQEAASFVTLSEYSDTKDMARARSYFADARRRVLVYTERAQFYNRHRIRGIRDIYFYQLPDHPQFYAELGNFIEESSQGSTMNVVFSKFDLLRLERIVGSARAKKMLSRSSGIKDGTFIFC
ncbi:hypothetical protein M9435_002906 [Picochlorum sp. BPE23]|nr:hypothetical protein M9435_002906 [Picochlorum sp. BPE23]